MAYFYRGMRVLIAGFGDRKLLDQTMEELIAASGCYLFTVVCVNENSLGAAWARDCGAPLEFLRDQSLERIATAADFLIAYNDGTDQNVKRLIMLFRASGRHGKVISPASP